MLGLVGEMPGFKPCWVHSRANSHKCGHGLGAEWICAPIFDYFPHRKIPRRPPSITRPPVRHDTDIGCYQRFHLLLQQAATK